MTPLITIIGAGPGISHGVAQKFGKEGYKVALIARNEHKLQQQVAELIREGVDAVYVLGDVSNKNSLKTALSKIKTTYGTSDMVLYNAAAMAMRDIMDTEWESIKTHLDTTVGGAIYTAQMLLPTYLKENKGKLFFTGGGFALEGNPLFSSLSIGKAGMRNVVQQLTQKTQQTGVHVAQITVCGMVAPDDPKYNPQAIAEQYWKLFRQKEGSFETEIIY